MSGTCHIVCAGPCEVLRVKPSEDDCLIAVDGGFAYCLEVGLAPDLFVGDLDSLASQLAERIVCERIELPREKDDTDTLFACKEGLKRGYTEFILHCALGGDIGHEIANMQTLAFLRAHDADGALRGTTQRVYLVTPQDGLRHFSAPIGTRVSVLAFGGDANGVTERGLQWELVDATLSSSLPLGVSNCSRAEHFEIGVQDGALLVVIG